MLCGKTDKLPVMMDDTLFEGMTSELRTALAAGYGAILEGIGDARVASFLYRHILPEVAGSIFDEGTMRRIFEMVNSDTVHDVTVYESPADRNSAGAPLTVKFTRDSGRPAFLRSRNVIEIPIMRYLAHSGFDVARSRVRGNPLVMVKPMPYRVFAERMRGVWDSPPGFSYDAPSLSEAISRELSVWLAHNRRPESVMNGSPRLSREDSEYGKLLGKAAEGKTVDTSYHEWKDANLRPAYRTERMSRGDAAILSAGRGWATPGVMRRHREITDRLRRNWAAGRKWMEGVPPEDRKFLEDFRRLADRYNRASFQSTNMELQARISSLAPWLVKLHASKGELPLKETLRSMLDRVFDIPADGPGIVGEERAFAKSCILPGAFRSAARRCAGMIDAVNRMPYTDEMSVGERIARLADTMAEKSSKEHISRQI